MSMVQPSGISRTLSILPGGTVPPNPTELLARQALVEAIDILKSTSTISCSTPLPSEW